MLHPQSPSPREQCPLFLVAYEAGEFIAAPWKPQALFQIVCQGEISIYYVRDDGSKYSLAQGSEAYCLGEMALFEEDNTTVFAQAVTDVICLAFLIAGNEEKFLSSRVLPCYRDISMIKVSE